MIYPKLGASEARTWKIDSPKRKFHTIWVAGENARTIDALLQHEVTHAVLAA